MGAHRLSGAVGEPILVSLYSLPKITLYPVVLLIFGLGISGKVAFGAMHGILPVALLTMGAIRAIPQVYLRSARTLHLSPWQTITHVLLPAALPEIFTGLRIGFTVTLLGVLLGEMFASKDGLGSMIMNAMALLQSQEMMMVAIVLFTFAAIANGAVAVDRASTASAGLTFPNAPARRRGPAIPRRLPRRHARYRHDRRGERSRAPRGRTACRQPPKCGVPCRRGPPARPTPEV